MISDRRNVIEDLRFGAQVAEEEAENLNDDFVETDQWKRLIGNEIDIVRGPKGSGKSALYALLNRNTDALFDKQVLLISAENPRGNTVFSEITTEPPPD